MEKLFEIFKVIMPPIISGILTFLITKYSYFKNIPLDNYKIAYNRVYYPIYTIIKSDQSDIDFNISKIKIYIRKYKKYIDKSTLRAFSYLCKCNTKAKKRDAYLNFENNICSKESFLRRRLGFLEPNFLQIYTYTSKAEKSTFRIIMEFILLYILYILMGIFQKINNIQKGFAYFFVIVLFILGTEIIIKFVTFLYYKIRK